MKRAYIVSSIVIVAAVAYLVFSFNSLSIALKSTGYSPGNITVLERGFNDEDYLVNNPRNLDPNYDYVDRQIVLDSKLRIDVLLKNEKSKELIVVSSRHLRIFIMN